MNFSRYPAGWAAFTPALACRGEAHRSWWSTRSWCPSPRQLLTPRLPATTCSRVPTRRMPRNWRHRSTTSPATSSRPCTWAYDADSCAGGAAGQQACGACIPACPYRAIRRDPANPLRVEVDHLSCEGCGACSAACPTSSLRFADPSPQALHAQLAALLAPNGGDTDQVLVFHCSEQGKRLIEEAGRRPLPYAANLLGVQVPCLRHVSAPAILGALRLGAAGVGLLGCAACPHGERAVLDRTLAFCRATMQAFDVAAERFAAVSSPRRVKRRKPSTPLPASPNPLPRRLSAGDGSTPPRARDDRQALKEIVSTFIEQRRLEPGRQPLDPALPFAVAEVKAEGCTLCRSCVNVCPTHAFRLDEPTSSLQFQPLRLRGLRAVRDRVPGGVSSTCGTRWFSRARRWITAPWCATRWWAA